MQRIIGWNLVLFLALAAASGCKSLQERRKAQTAAPPQASLPCPGQQPFVPPSAPAPAPPQTGFPPLSAPAPQNPQPVFPPSGSQPPPPAPSPGPQKAEYRWQPAPESAQPFNPSIQLGTPEPLVPEPKEKLKLYPPETPEQEKVPLAKKDPPPLFPVGIPNFSPVKEQVASGLRPSLDGLDWLKDNGYRGILFVRAPGEDDSTDKKQIEKRGLKYLTLEVSPTTLTPQIVDDFNQIVNAGKDYPLFVYDRDGSLSGGLWFLHFRGGNASADDAARDRARSLGFREDRDDSHRAMWLAIQKLLSK